MNNKNFEAISHTDIKGNKLYYIKLTNGEQKHFINVGEKTFEIVSKLEKHEPTEKNETVAARVEQQEQRLKQEMNEKNILTKTTGTTIEEPKNETTTSVEDNTKIRRQRNG